MALDVDTGNIIRLRNVPEKYVIGSQTLRRWTYFEVNGLVKSSTDSRHESYYFAENTTLRVINLSSREQSKLKADALAVLESIAIDAGTMRMMPQAHNTNRSIYVIRTQPHNIDEPTHEFDNGKQFAKSNGQIAPAVTRLKLINDNGHLIRSGDGTFGMSVTSYKVLTWDYNVGLVKALAKYYKCSPDEVSFQYQFDSERKARNKVVRSCFGALHLDKPRLLIVGNDQMRQYTWYVSGIYKSEVIKQKQESRRLEQVYCFQVKGGQRIVKNYPSSLECLK